MELEKQIGTAVESEYGRTYHMIEISEKDAKILSENKIFVDELNPREGNTNERRKMFLIENDPKLLEKIKNLDLKE